MEPNTPNPTVFVVTLTDKGLRTKTHWRAPFLNLGDWLASWKDAPWVWSPHTWRGDVRAAENWEAASCVVLDLDFADAWAELPTGHVKPNHVAVTDDARGRFEAALRELPPELAGGEVLAHHTPRGARVVLLLAAPITDEPTFKRVAKRAGELVKGWLALANLLADERTRCGGYTVDPASFDVGRKFWAPNAVTDDGPRRAAVVTCGTPGVFFEAAQLDTPTDTTDLAPEKTHAPHPAWASIREALLRRPGSKHTKKGVEVCCPVHGERNASAIVFESGVLKCLASSCPADTAQPLAVWARAHGPELLGEELARMVAGVGTDSTPMTRLGDYWRTVSEWQSDSGESWFDSPPPQREWLLTVPANGLYSERRVLPRGVVGMLAAGGSVGKTMALVQLAVAVASGRRWLACDRGSHSDFPGFETPEGGGRVLLALGEEDAGEARRRLHAAVMGAGLNAAEKALVASRIVVAPLMGQAVQLIAPADKYGNEPPRPTAFAEELRARLRDSPEPWSLVVVDPLSRWAGPDTETDNAAATKFVQLLETFTRAPGNPSVLVAHHNTKASRREGELDDTGARGASALSDGVRWHAAMRAKPHPEGPHGVGIPRMAELRVVKTNYGMPLDETLWLARDEGGWLRAASGMEKTAFVEASKAAEAKAKAKAEETKQSKAEATTAHGSRWS
jgi:RecA-family ATPase